MKITKRIMVFGSSALGAMALLSVLGAVFNAGDGPNISDGVPLNAVDAAVQAVLGQMSQEQAEADQAARQAATATALSVAHTEALATLADFQLLSAAVDCQRQRAIKTKLDGMAADGVSFEEALDREMKALVQRWQQWKANGGVIQGDAEKIAPFRALVNDTNATLRVADAFYSAQGEPICADTADTQIFNLSQVSLAVAARREQHQRVVAAVTGEEAIRVNWNQYRATGAPQYRANIEALASQHGINLAAMGIDLDSIAVVEAGM